MRRATRCAVGRTRSCGGSWRGDWDCDDDSQRASQRGTSEERSERGVERGAGPMTDQDLVVETVRDILADHEPFVLTPERRWDAGLWRTLAEAGLTGVGLPEEAGGSGGEPADAVAIVRTLAAGAAAVPVAEQLLVAGPPGGGGRPPPPPPPEGPPLPGRGAGDGG